MMAESKLAEKEGGLKDCILTEYSATLALRREQLRANHALNVIGPIAPSSINNGVILPHEHLLLDFVNATLPNKENLKDISVSLENYGKISRHPYSVSANLKMDSVQDIVEELKRFKENGGSTICELTTVDRLKLNQLKYISEATGVTIVCGTGFYIDSFMTTEEKAMSVDELAQVMIDEIVTGIPGSDGVRCGIIGEIGCSWPLTVNERKVLQAAAITQQQTGAPLIIHPGRGSSSPFEIVDILLGAGADLSRTVMSHLDRTLFNHEDFIRFAKTGCILEFDLFGVECSHYQLDTSIDMPSDAQRIAAIKMLCDKGYASRVLISHDIHTKHRLVKYGGHGYHHIPLNILPKMRDRGITDEHIHQITVTNPKQWLTFQ